MYSPIVVIALKSLDSSIKSCKSLSTHKLDYKGTFIYSAIGSFLFLTVIKNLEGVSIPILSLSTGLFTALPVFYANRKKSKIENTWRYNVKCKNIDQSIRFATKLRAKDIEVVANDNVISTQSTIMVQCVAHNPQESKYIMKCIPSKCKVIIDKGDIESFTKK